MISVLQLLFCSVNVSSSITKEYWFSPAIVDQEIYWYTPAFATFSARGLDVDSFLRGLVSAASGSGIRQSLSSEGIWVLSLRVRVPISLFRFVFYLLFCLPYLVEVNSVSWNIYFFIEYISNSCFSLVIFCFTDIILISVCLYGRSVFPQQ